MNDLTHEKGFILEEMIKCLRFGDKATRTRPLQIVWPKIAKQVGGGGFGLEA